jgi:hypothetical protein
MDSCCQALNDMVLVALPAMLFVDEKSATVLKKMFSFEHR